MSVSWKGTLMLGMFNIMDQTKCSENGLLCDYRKPFPMGHWEQDVQMQIKIPKNIHIKLGKKNLFIYLFKL